MMHVRRVARTTCCPGAGARLRADAQEAVHPSTQNLGAASCRSALLRDPDNKLSGPLKRLVNVDAEEETRRPDDHDRSRWRTVVIRGRSIIVGRRRGHVSGRRRHPIGVGAILDVGELVGAPRDRCGEKQYERGHERKEQLFHHKIRRTRGRFGSNFLRGEGVTEVPINGFGGSAFSGQIARETKVFKPSKQRKLSSDTAFFQDMLKSHP
jgi:hypothetical protein